MEESKTGIRDGGLAHVRVRDVLVRQEMVNQIEDLAGNYYFVMFMTRPWERLLCASDYYDMLWTSDPQRAFEVMNSMSQVIEQTVNETTNTEMDPFTFSELMTGAKPTHIYQSHRDQAVSDKRHPENQLIPYSPYEMYLYHLIMQGGESWQTVTSTYEHLTNAMRKNPPAALALMQGFGLDLMLPDFPAATMEEIPAVTKLLEQWDGDQDGIEFFSQAMKQAGISDQEENESADAYWKRSITMLPDLEKYLDYDITEGQNQKPEYYMQICIALAYFPLHRKLRYDEMQEAVAALLVRDGKVLGASYNIPTDRPHLHKHAEQLAIEKAVKKSGDPFLHGASLFVNIEPCVECGPIIRKYNLSELYFGPRTLMGADTRSSLFTAQLPTWEIPSGDFLAEQGEPYFPIPKTVVSNMFYKEIADLIVNGQKWKKFILPPPIQSK